MIPVSIVLVLDPASPMPATEIRLGVGFWGARAPSRAGDCGLAIANLKLVFVQAWFEREQG
jgi:hypothetical protein